ncbi:MAG: class I SAM-dependent methyltransferase [Cyanobacterium sp. T60_A2020_053]|nr:class I SAM-dependent methyltransferase [Cyanobacterium sp. T60_A2020_053]
MTASSNIETFLVDNLLKNSYQTWQQLKAVVSVAHKNFFTQLKDTLFPTEDNQLIPLTPEVFKILQERFSQITEEDWQDAKQGVYPYEILFDGDVGYFLSNYVKLLWDHPLAWYRVQQKNFIDLPTNIDLEKYPQYYRRNFHYQTDGYLSDNSAQIYDLQVEILFSGIADAMRRRILKPLKEKLPRFSQDTKILDVACGTGRTLKLLRATFPDASLYGIDLSSAYLREANRYLLSQFPEELPQLMEGKGEAMPYQDNYFQAISNVFLFHELPKPIRKQVIEESYRVLQPGGVMVICDSIQLSDSPELEVMMGNFPRAYHEPFYNDYINDNMEEHLEKSGFHVESVNIHAFSKYWVATKSF